MSLMNASSNELVRVLSKRNQPQNVVKRDFLRSLYSTETNVPRGGGEA